MVSPKGHIFLDRYGFLKEAKRRNKKLDSLEDWKEFVSNIEKQFQCLLQSKHFFDSVENPHDHSDKNQGLLLKNGWTPHLSDFKSMTRSHSAVQHQPPGSKSWQQAAEGLYSLSVQAGVDTDLATEMCMQHGRDQDRQDVLILIATDGDFESTLRKLRRERDSVFILSWDPQEQGFARLAVKLTAFQKQGERKPGEEELYVYLDDLLQARTVPSPKKTTSAAGSAANAVRQARACADTGTTETAETPMQGKDQAIAEEMSHMRLDSIQAPAEGDALQSSKDITEMPQQSSSPSGLSPAAPEPQPAPKTEHHNNSPAAKKVCMAFVAGTCHFGNKCHDRHPDDAACQKLREQLANKDCKHGAKCRLRTKGCLYRHP